MAQQAGAPAQVSSLSFSTWLPLKLSRLGLPLMAPESRKEIIPQMARERNFRYIPQAWHRIILRTLAYDIPGEESRVGRWKGVAKGAEESLLLLQVRCLGDPA
jgi:hypothetical protein